MKETGSLSNEIYDKAVNYTEKFSTLHSNMRTWTQFRHGKQWKATDEQDLLEIGHAPVVVDYTDPCIEHLCSNLTANNPKFSAVGRMDADVKIGRMWANWLAYMFDISEGRAQHMLATSDFAERGVAWYQLNDDGDSSYGLGDLKFRRVDPFMVFPDYTSKHVFADDADEIILLDNFNAKQWKKAYPDYVDAFKSSSADQFLSAPEDKSLYDYGDRSDTGDVVFPWEYYDGSDDIKTAICHYSLDRVHLYYVFNASFNRSKVMDFKELKAYMKEVVPIFELNNNGQPVYFEAPIDERIVQMMSAGYKEKGIEHRIIPATREILVQYGVVNIRKFSNFRARKRVQLGKDQIYDVELPISRYPVIPVYDRFTGSPLGSRSRIADVINMQRYSNKFMSLTMAYMQSAVGVKVMTPRGSLMGKRDEFDMKILKPSFNIEFDASLGSPFAFQLPPLPSQIFVIMQNLKHMIEYHIGTFEGSMGNPEALPETFRTTVAADNYAMKRMAYIVKRSDDAFSRLASVAIEWAGQYYNGDRMFRILSDKPTEESQFVVNQQINFDDYRATIAKADDAEARIVDVITVAGSSLPSNKMAEYQMALQAYKESGGQIVDAYEVRKKGEFFDVDGITARIDEKNRLMANIESLETELKKVNGDLQTAQREAVHAKMKVEVNNFETELSKELLRIKAMGTEAASTVIKKIEGELDKFKAELVTLKPAEETPSQQ